MRLFSQRAQTRVSATSDADTDNEYSTDGPTGIRVVADPFNASIDIVFVHGLTGNREKTWTHRNKTFWPGALLPQDFPSARILTFGYDSDIVRFWSVASSNRLDDHSQSLAYALLDQRGTAGKRPIIFIAHSLGGLVCEGALNLSSKRQDLSSLLANTLGIIFMGTPHGGSSVARWGLTLAKYLNVFLGTNRDVLGNLQPGSSDLQRTEEDFQYMLRRADVKLKIYCFYEALKMHDMVGKIVERESAVLPAYDNCSINANHRTMTKFTGRADAGYGQVRGVLERWIEEHEREKRNLGTSQASQAQVSTADSRGSPAEQRAQNSSMNDYGIGGGHTYHGPVFNGTISGRYVIPGAHTTGGTVNFNFPG